MKKEDTDFCPVCEFGAIIKKKCRRCGAEFDSLDIRRDRMKKKEKTYPRITRTHVAGLLLLFMFTGCVSIKTHERAKRDNYAAGITHGVYMSLVEVETSHEGKDELIHKLRSFLSVEELRRLRKTSKR